MVKESIAAKPATNSEESKDIIKDSNAPKEEVKRAEEAKQDGNVEDSSAEISNTSFPTDLPLMKQGTRRAAVTHYTPKPSTE